MRTKTRQKGLSLIEMAVAAMIIGLTIIVTLRVYNIILKGISVSKNMLRADNLCVTKLDDLRNAAQNATYGNTWSGVTGSSLALSYATPQVVSMETTAFTWNVISEFVAQSPSAGLTPAAVVAVPAGNTSTMVRLTAWVGWKDAFRNKQITKTAYVSDIRR